MNLRGFGYRYLAALAGTTPAFMRQSRSNDEYRSRGAETHNNLTAANESASRVDETTQLFDEHRAANHRILRTDGWTAEAVLLSEQHLSDVEEFHGPDHYGTLSARYNLAIAYNSVGRVAEAISLFEQTLADAERALGPDAPSTLDLRDDLARVYTSVGRIAEAISLFEQTLTLTEQIFGPDHPRTLNSRDNLASAYTSVGRAAEAISLYEQNLAASQRILGPDHPDTLTVQAKIDQGAREHPREKSR